MSITFTFSIIGHCLPFDACRVIYRARTRPPFSWNQFTTFGLCLLCLFHPILGLICLHYSTLLQMNFKKVILYSNGRGRSLSDVICGYWCCCWNLVLFCGQGRPIGSLCISLLSICIPTLLLYHKSRQRPFVASTFNSPKIKKSSRIARLF